MARRRFRRRRRNVEEALRNQELVASLDRLGYYKGDYERRPSAQGVIDAVKRYQIIHGLPVTGALNRRTASMLGRSRCGVSDAPLVQRINPIRGAAFAVAAASATANYSSGASMGYRIRSFSGQFTRRLERSIYRSAFRTWEDILRLRFREVNANEDFFVEWRNQAHFANNNVLAHANRDHISFSNSFTWTDNRAAVSYDLFSVAAHEVGHVLGLDHEAGQRDIMFSTFNFREIRRFVRKGEFDQARAIYQLRPVKGSIQHGIVAGDYDGDGEEEIGLLRNSDGNVYIFRFDNANNLIEEASNWRPGVRSRWISACSADLDGSGTEALVAVRDFDDGFYAWRSDGRNFVQLASNTSPGPNSAWIKLVSGDFDGDGSDEIIAVRDFDDGFHMYKYDGSQLNPVTANTSPGPNSAWIDMVSGDFDGDGSDEIIAVRDYDDGFHMYKYDGSQLRSVVANTTPGPNSAWIVMGAGDIDGDGVDEVVAIREYDDGFFAYKYDGSDLRGLVSNTTPGPNSAWRDVTLGDFDGDGVDEIVAVRDFDDGVFMLKLIPAGPNGQPMSLNIVAGNTLPGPNSDWKGMVAVRTGSTSSRDSVALIRDYDADVHLFDYDPISSDIRWLGTG